MFFYFFVFEIEKYLNIDNYKCGFEFLKLNNIKPLIQKAKGILMKKVLKTTLCGFLLLVAHQTWANDAPKVDTKIANDFSHEKLTNPNQDMLPSGDDLLRKQKLEEAPDAKKAAAAAERAQALADEELLSKPEQLEKILALNLASNQFKHIEKLKSLYQQVKDKDESLVEWADAMLMSRKDINGAIRQYRVLLSKFPNNDFIRFQLANLLYQNQELEAAKDQFEKLRSSTGARQEDIAIFDNYLNAISNKDKWNFGLSASFLNDKNLNDLADMGTSMTLPNGAVISQSSPKEKGTGLDTTISTNKQWSLKNGYYAGMDANVGLKYYWNNKSYNDLNTYIGAKFGYANARLDVKINPFYMKRFQPERSATNKSGKFKSYTNTVGVTLSSGHWITPNLKQFANYTISKEFYKDENLHKRYGGVNQSVGTTFMYLNGPKQYFGVGADVSRRRAGEDENAYFRYSGRVFWGQEWPLGFSTTTNLSYAKRLYDAPWLGIMRRENKELNASVGLWHKAVHFKGFTPRLTFSYQKTKSNVPIYSYDKKLVFIELDKSF